MNNYSLIGDCKEAVEVAKDIYGDTLSLDDAQCLSDTLTQEMKWPNVLVTKGRVTRNKHGSIRFIHTDAPVMTLNKPSIGIVIHELSHLAYRSCLNQRHRTCPHDQGFKSAQRLMLKKWLGTVAKT